jgi:hypothetical protein
MYNAAEHGEREVNMRENSNPCALGKARWTGSMAAGIEKLAHLDWSLPLKPVLPCAHAKVPMRWIKASHGLVPRNIGFASFSRFFS